MSGIIAANRPAETLRPRKGTRMARLAVFNSERFRSFFSGRNE
jgi:hypothetical protein